jgi:hypothetical protein
MARELRRSPGPWVEGVHIPHGSTDGQPCIYSDTRDLPLVVFDGDDVEAAGNCRLMAYADALHRKLSELADALYRYAMDCDDDNSEELAKQARCLIREATTKPRRSM